MAKIGYWSNLKGDSVVSDGQVLKSRSLLAKLKQHFSDGNIFVVDVHRWKRRPVRTFFKTIKMIKKSETIIISTSYGGLNLILKIINLLFKKRQNDFILIAVGGRLNKYAEENKTNMKLLKGFKTVLVQGTAQMVELKNLGFINVEVFPNFREYHPILKKYDSPSKKNIDLCVFSRITKEKGVSDAIQAVYEANKILGENIFSVDFYGNIAEDYKNEFFSELDLLGENGKYKGVAKSEEAPGILCNYFLLLFLTYHNGEGQAGTILDSYFAGIPVIATKWNLNSEFVFENKNGYLVNIKSPKEAAEKLVYAYENFEQTNSMRKEASLLAEQYTPNKVMPILLKYLQGSNK